RAGTLSEQGNLRRAPAVFVFRVRGYNESKNRTSGEELDVSGFYCDCLGSAPGAAALSVGGCAGDCRDCKGKQTGNTPRQLKCQGGGELPEFSGGGEKREAEKSGKTGSRREEAAGGAAERVGAAGSG